MQRRTSNSRVREERDFAIGLSLFVFSALIVCVMLLVGLIGPGTPALQQMSGYGVTGELVSAEAR